MSKEIMCPLSFLSSAGKRRCPEESCAFWHSAAKMCSIKNMLIHIAVVLQSAHDCARSAEEWLREHKVP